MNIELFFYTLTYMAKGMAGIFCVTIVIIASIVVLNKVSSCLDKRSKEQAGGNNR